MRTLQWTVGLALVALCAAPALAEQSIHSAFDYGLGPQSIPAPSTNQGIHTAFDYGLGSLPQPVPVTQQSIQTAFNYSLSDEQSNGAAAKSSGCGCEEEPACGCEPDCACEPGCGCEPSCGCEGDGGWFGCCDDCLGDAWSIHDQYMCDCDHVIAGWFTLGYHSDLTGLSREYNDLRDFNDVPGNFNINQAYLYFEKVADGSACSCDWGYRFDAMYGTDARKMQATGNPTGFWDNSWDHGIYGWALPQAYVEGAYGNMSAIVGHFITPMGYESRLAPESFFYSMSLQAYNSEPFTHTGVLTKYKTDNGVTWYNGWTLGWDTGFDQFGGGSNYLGGVGYKPNDDFEIVYLTTIGNFGRESSSSSGYAHAFYIAAALSENWEYGLASDYRESNGFTDEPGFHVEDIGVTNYLYYTVTERLALGGRAEWWKSNQVSGRSTSFYEITGGINYWVNANIVIRPEMRYDWTPSEAGIGDFQYNRGIFGIDAIVTY